MKNCGVPTCCKCSGQQMSPGHLPQTSTNTPDFPRPSWTHHLLPPPPRSQPPYFLTLANALAFHPGSSAPKLPTLPSPSPPMATRFIVCLSEYLLSLSLFFCPQRHRLSLSFRYLLPGLLQPPYHWALSPPLSSPPALLWSVAVISRVSFVRSRTYSQPPVLTAARVTPPLQSMVGALPPLRSPQQLDPHIFPFPGSPLCTRTLAPSTAHHRPPAQDSLFLCHPPPHSPRPSSGVALLVSQAQLGVPPSLSPETLPCISLVALSSYPNNLVQSLTF